MKKHFLLLLFICSAATLTAQVGINADHSLPDASAMLDIKSTNKGLLIPRTATGNIATPAKGLIIYDTVNNAIQYYNGTAWTQVSSGAGYWNAAGNNIYSSNSGNIGMGVVSPVAKLDIKTTDLNPLKITGADPMYISLFEGNNYRGYLGSFSGAAEDVDIGTGLGNTTGRMHLSIQASPKLTVAANGNVGIGTILPASKLDVIGDVNLTGAFKINSSAGTAGQVLTSTGTGAPEWQTASFSNNIRFGFRGSAAGNVSNPYTYTTQYNTSPADVSIGTNSIVFNKAGLYHLEGNFNNDIEYNGSVAYQPFSYTYLDVSNPVVYFQILYDYLLRDNSVSSPKYNVNRSFSIDIYLNAGATVKFRSYTYPDTGSGTIFFGYSIDLRGYLISP